MSTVARRRRTRLVRSRRQSPLDAGAAERLKRPVDPARRGRIRRMRVPGVGRRVRAVVEPDAGGVALETVQRPRVGDLDRAELFHGHRHQHARHRCAPRLAREAMLPVLDGDDDRSAPRTRATRRPRGRRITAASTRRRCPPPPAAPAPGRREENVPFIWRLVRLTRGRSWVRGGMPMRFSWAAR